MPPLYTIGYEGVTQAAVIDALTQAGVAMLLDVRELPLSRKPGFSKRSLAEGLAAHGILYVHLRDLGTPITGRQAHKRGAVKEFERIYLAQLHSPEGQAALAEASFLVAEKPCVLFCYEREPAQCHRHFVAEALEESGGPPAIHLFP